MWPLFVLTFFYQKNEKYVLEKDTRLDCQSYFWERPLRIWMIRLREQALKDCGSRSRLCTWQSKEGRTEPPSSTRAGAEVNRRRSRAPWSTCWCRSPKRSTCWSWSSPSSRSPWWPRRWQRGWRPGERRWRSCTLSQSRSRAGFQRWLKSSLVEVQWELSIHLDLYHTPPFLCQNIVSASVNIFIRRVRSLATLVGDSLPTASGKKTDILRSGWP